MSHEFRTPIIGIVGLTEMLRDTKLDSAQVSVLDSLDAINDRLIGILNDVLDLSKIEADKFTLEERPFDPGAVSAGVCEILNRLAAEKGSELTWQASTDFPTLVLCDVRGLR
jgi:signal transduction histidine kinase